MKILVIEDDKDIAELIAFNFKQEQWKVDVSHLGAKGLELAKNIQPDLIILDLMLPDKSGMEICRELRANAATKKIPIMMLTAKSEEIDRVVGFEMGADDYLTKPFSVRELILRVKAIVRRATQPKNLNEQSRLKVGFIELDTEKYEVLVKKKPVKLTAIEFKLLKYLLEHCGRVATRDNLLDQVWGYEAALTTRTVDTHIKRLRAKLGKAGDDIETIRGIGYRYKEQGESH